MKKSEICLYCNADYIPKRRGVQKFCSDSCRSGHWKLNQEKKEEIIIGETTVNDSIVIGKDEKRKEKMSLAGVGNAAVGVAAVEAMKKLLIPEENQPATKKDIQELKTLIQSRYLLVKNLKNDIMGRSPYYDIVTGNVVYFEV